tara:strand:- start:572 stop:784 length:213 start_codon:yes stop_codon:yes gene_type:complete
MFGLLLPTKLFSVFFTMRLLPGVFDFASSTGTTHFATRLCGMCVANHETVTLVDKILCDESSFWLNNINV